MICNNTNITLQEAMSQGLPQTLKGWWVPGLHVEYSQTQENLNVTQTTIFKNPDGIFEVALSFNLAENCGSHFVTIATFSTLEDLRDKFPNLFELKGNFGTAG